MNEHDDASEPGGPLEPASVGPVGIVDDDPTLRLMLRLWLEAAGYTVQEHATGTGLLGDEEATLPAVLFLDLGLADMPGEAVLRHLRARDPDVAVIVVTARREIETAVAMMRLGAFDYLAKPLDEARVLAALEAALARQVTAERLRRQRNEPDEAHVLGTVVGKSAALRAMATQVQRVLDSDVNVCLLGESGVGKEVVARALHQLGRRRRGAFVAVNCAAIPAALQESELFGHERGSFTGASSQHRGRFEQAQDGTLFLDELGEMSPGTQAALLRTLQERTIRRVGGMQEIPVNARIVCATHRDLEAEVEAGRFRQDLYYRLVVYPVEVPALRERREDIPLLVGHFLRRLRADVGREVKTVSAEALDAFARHEWPGNVRELQNLVHRAMLACDGEQLELAHLPAMLRRLVLPMVPTPLPAPPPMPQGSGAPAQDDDTVETLAELERRAIEKAMRVAGNSVGRAARLLGIGRTTLYRRLAELGLEPSKA